MLKRTNDLTRTYDKPEGWALAAYEREIGGYQTARRVLTTMTREQVVDEAKKANLRGRGGAGFPMGVKWSFMPKV
ncbi:MAG: NADH-quinone oxidoreductase subunit NuoF, partial [Polyangiaceae bacterium]